ncbi:MAG: DnaA regulatory inactivator Hda [Pseudomonadota bacterium]
MRDQQLPLRVKLPDHAVFDNFYAGPNEELVAYLCDQPQAMTWVWGEPSTGKTHLLQASAARFSQSAYLPLADVQHYGPRILSGYGAFDQVCLDDLDQVVTDDASSWEDALFELFQDLSERGATLIVASRAAPQNVALSMADLKSRLLSGPVYRLQVLDDDERLKAMQLRAWRRGLKLPDATGEYLLKRLQRDMKSLCDFLDHLDTASLVRKSKLTVALVKATLDARQDAHSAPGAQI